MIWLWRRLVAVFTGWDENGRRCKRCGAWGFAVPCMFCSSTCTGCGGRYYGNEPETCPFCGSRCVGTETLEQR